MQRLYGVGGTRYNSPWPNNDWKYSFKPINPLFKMSFFKQIMFSFLLLSVLAACASDSGTNETAATRQADVIIYGGTSAAVTAAVQVTENGQVRHHRFARQAPGRPCRRAAWALPTRATSRSSAGCRGSFTTACTSTTRSPKTGPGRSRPEYGNKGQGTPAMDGNNRTMWIFEPHAAEQVFEDLIKENNITVYRDEWLDRSKKGVDDEKRRNPVVQNPERHYLRRQNVH